MLDFVIRGLEALAVLCTLLLGVPLVVLWFKLAKRSVSVVDRVPEAL